MCLIKLGIYLPLLDRRLTEYAIATACFCGLPAAHLSANIIGKCFFGFAFLQWHYYDFIMKVLKVITWSGYKKYQEALMNAEGRLSICINDPKVRIDRITIEPNDPDSKVQFTHYGAKYTSAMTTHNRPYYCTVA